MTNVEELTWQSGQVLLAFAIVIAFGFSVARLLPSLPGFESLILGPPGAGPDEPRLRIESSNRTSSSVSGILTGEKGVALTMLRPSGKARFENRVLDVISDGPFISADAQLEVIATSGNRIVVRQI